MARKRKQEPERSPAWQLLAHVWKHCPRPGVDQRGSWSRLNQSMRAALDLAISSGCEFDVGDFAGLEEAFHFGYWGIVDGGFAEGFYRLAVAENNLSAAKSFEHWKGRGPFIAGDVGDRQRDRLAVGSCFSWQGEEVTVTSFSKCGEYLTACSYKPRTKDAPYSATVLHRYKITTADIQANRKARKRRDELYTVATRLNRGQQKRLYKSLGVVTREGWDALPVDRIEAAIKEVTT